MAQETILIDDEEYDLDEMKEAAIGVAASASGSSTVEVGLAVAVVHLVNEVLALRGRVEGLAG